MTHVPALRAALQDAADRRYGRSRWRRRAFVLAPAFVLALIGVTVVIGLGHPAPEQPAKPGALHTLKVTTLPASTKKLHVLAPKLVAQDEAETAYAAAGSPGVVDGRVVRAWSARGIDGLIFLVRGGHDWNVVMPDPSAPGGWTASGTTPGIYRRFGVTLAVDDVYVGVIGPGLEAPLYTAPDGTKRNLQLAEGRIVALTGAADGAAVTLRGLEIDRDDAISVPPSKRYECSDGSHVDLPGDWKPRVDPCASKEADHER